MRRRTKGRQDDWDVLDHMNFASVTAQARFKAEHKLRPLSASRLLWGKFRCGRCGCGGNVLGFSKLQDQGFTGQQAPKL
jgi:hypothetical protein